MCPCCIGKLKFSLREPPLRVPTTDAVGAGRCDSDEEDEACLPGGDQSQCMSLTHPRSQWLRARLPYPKLRAVIAAADHSGYDFDDPAADWKRKCKTVLEIDRNEAAREQGYTVSIYKLVPPHACPKNDVLVGEARSSTCRPV
jgi:hypothetical protein